MFSNNNKYILKLLIGFRIGLSALFFNIFKYSFLRIGLKSGYFLQLEINAKYLFPFLLFCKKHTLCLFTILTDITCFESLGSKYKYILIYSLLNIKNSFRLLLKLQVTEFNNTLLSTTSIFSCGG
jgi:NADH:ubiquinone oxidoreductase subunit C